MHKTINKQVIVKSESSPGKYFKGILVVCENQIRNKDLLFIRSGTGLTTFPFLLLVSEIVRITLKM